MKEQHIVIRTSLPIKNIFHQPTSARVQIPTLSKWRAYLQHRSTLFSSPLSLEMQVVLGPVEYVDPLNVLTSIPLGALLACREVEESPTDASCTDGSNRGNPPT